MWGVARWLSVLPYPYTLKDAEDFYNEMTAAALDGKPQFYAISLKSDQRLIGGVAVHPPRESDAASDAMEIGYWLGINYWGNGYMVEAASRVIALAFETPSTQALIATTAPANKASQKVLRRIGLKMMGLGPRNYTALRGPDSVLKWQLTRDEWEDANCEDNNIRYAQL